MSENDNSKKNVLFPIVDSLHTGWRCSGVTFEIEIGSLDLIGQSIVIRRIYDFCIASHLGSKPTKRGKIDV